MEPNRAQADNITTDNIIVLSFRNLQLKRIGALQDKLIELSLIEKQINWEHQEVALRVEQNERVDEALRVYGE